MRKFSQEELVEKLRSERSHIKELYDEINQLRQENANLKDYVKSLKDECISCPENKNVKQAKLEVLKELKDILNDKPDGFAYIIYIDDMIKELQNETK